MVLALVDSLENYLNDKRRSRRKALASQVAVHNLITGDPFGHIGNLSTEGIMLICRQPVAEGLLFQLAFELEDADGSTREFHLGAHCLWCSPANIANSYWAGFEIMDISDQDADLLNRIINQL